LRSAERAQFAAHDSLQRVHITDVFSQLVVVLIDVDHAADDAGDHAPPSSSAVRDRARLPRLGGA
jgi:hypothetical protein